MYGNYNRRWSRASSGWRRQRRECYCYTRHRQPRHYLPYSLWIPWSTDERQETVRPGSKRKLIWSGPVVMKRPTQESKISSGESARRDARHVGDVIKRCAPLLWAWMIENSVTLPMKIYVVSTALQGGWTAARNCGAPRRKRRSRMRSSRESPIPPRRSSLLAELWCYRFGPRRNGLCC